MRPILKPMSAAFLALLLPNAILPAQTDLSPTTEPTTEPFTSHKGVPADQPAAKSAKTGEIQEKFEQKHESFLQRGKAGKIGVLFLGDSITERWARASPIWDQYYKKYDPANFGIGGDHTQHVLWRIDHGELDGINPKVLVLMIGTNNTSTCAADEIVRGDYKIVDEINQKLPHTKILLLGVFPRGHDPKDPKIAEVRDKLKSVNQSLAKLDGKKNVTYLDIGNKFLDPDGQIQTDIMVDFVHPTPKGYQIWADAMQPTLDRLMQ